MTDFLSVIIPTYNPAPERIRQTLTALKRQSLPVECWELIIVDNNSDIPFQPDLSWHQNHIVLTEPRQGITFARVAGFKIAKGNIMVMVDDDNLLRQDYLQRVLSIFKQSPRLGAIGGIAQPLFETTPPVWLKEFYPNLALRDLGDQILTDSWDCKYPPSAPIGAGMAVRKEALKAYIDKIASGKNIITDRSGDSLCSGGDNDIVLEIIKSGWETGYFPDLILHHIIPPHRMQPDYLARLLHDTNKSWVELLQYHHINPWPQISPSTTALRKLKAWFILKSWKNEVNYIKWRGACGMFDGLVKKKQDNQQQMHHLNRSI